VLRQSNLRAYFVVRINVVCPLFFLYKMHELNALRKIFDEEEGEIQARMLMRHIGSGIPNNLHDQAWDVADKMVRALRDEQ